MTWHRNKLFYSLKIYWRPFMFRYWDVWRYNVMNPGLMGIQAHNQIIVKLWTTINRSRNYNGKTKMRVKPSLRTFLQNERERVSRSSLTKYLDQTRPMRETLSIYSLISRKNHQVISGSSGGSILLLSSLHF